VAKGTTLCGLLNRRITVPPSDKSHDRKSGDAETVMKHYIERNFLNPTDPDRKMPNFRIKPNRGRGKEVKWESRYKNVADEIIEISKESGLGWEVTVDYRHKRFEFDVIESRDLTQGNPQGNNPVFFSPDFENVKGMDFTDSDADLRNFGYVGGQGEGEERKIIELGDIKGWDRFETFVDARDIGTQEEDEEELSDEEIEELLIERGEKKMREMQSLLSLEAEIITPITRTNYEDKHTGYRSPAQPSSSKVRKQQVITPFMYEEDFDLGDKVDIVNKSWNLYMPTPIVEITEIHEPEGFQIEAVFGENKPTIGSRLKRKFDEIEDVDRNEKYYEYVDKKVDKVEKDNKVDVKPLWTGNVSPTDKDTIRPTKKLTECRNGWILQFQRFVKGEGTKEESITFHYVHKSWIENGKEGKGMPFNLRRWFTKAVIFKYLY